MPHQNRSGRGASRNPSPQEIRAARAQIGLTQTEAGKIVHATLSAWQHWESGTKRMNPATWALFRLKTELISHENDAIDQNSSPPQRG